jgi:hypothetical protein
MIVFFMETMLSKCHVQSNLEYIGFKIINLDCVIGRRGITIPLPPSILAKLIILKPIEFRIYQTRSQQQIL